MADIDVTIIAAGDQISRPDDPAADFRIDGPEVHGVSGLVNLFGIESPGLTASLAMAEEVFFRLG